MGRLSRATILLILAACGGEGPTPIPNATLPDPQVITSAAPDPEAAARAYLDAWSERDYASMYKMLSPLSRDSITEQAFAERHDEVWRLAAIEGLDYEITSAFVESPRSAQVRVRNTLNSIAAGPIHRDLQLDFNLEDEVWSLAWSDGLILPELEGGSGLFLDVITPTRANIYDREGLALAAPAEAVALWIVPNQIGDEEAEATMLSTLRRLLDFPSDNSILQRYDAIRDTDFRINLGQVSLAEFQAVQGTLSSVGGVQWDVYPTRLYPAGGLGPHTVGYISWIQEAELEEYQANGYEGDEFVGQIGIEYWFEEFLRGIPGGTLYTTDAAGRPNAAIASQAAEPPYAVYTTLDRELQRHTQQALKDSALTGSVVVLERDTGAVLAMASSPDFDPNLFDTSNPNSATGLTEVFQLGGDPLLNRATVGTYPAGSVFKMITMAAALESGYYQPDTIYNCGLEFRELQGVTLYDWRYEKELPAAGEITLMQALERSCNPYFYHIGLDLFNRGLPTAIPDMAKGFGLGVETGIEIGEVDGLIPDPENKQSLYGEDWTSTDPVQLAIGQSYMLATPLQVVRYVAAIGNGGTLFQPQLIDRIENANGEILFQFEPEAQGTLPISLDTLKALQEAMIGVVRDPRATAYRPFLGLHDINIAGKTGTAQTGPNSDPHAWFVGYTFEGREDLPDIAVVVMLEQQGEGSEWAAPVFKRVVESYFKGGPISRYPWEERIRVVAPPEPPEEEEANGEG